MRMAQKGCEECGQLSPFHAPTCKRLPAREDLIATLREMLAEKSALLETVKQERDLARADVGRLTFQVEKEHECAEELKEGLCKQFRESATEVDALEAKLRDANLQVDEAKKLMAEMDDASARDDWAEACLEVLERMMKFVNGETNTRYREGDGHVCIAAEGVPCSLCGRHLT